MVLAKSSKSNGKDDKFEYNYSHNLNLTCKKDFIANRMFTSSFVTI